MDIQLAESAIDHEPGPAIFPGAIKMSNNDAGSPGQTRFPNSSVAGEIAEAVPVAGSVLCECPAVEALSRTRTVLEAFTMHPDLISLPVVDSTTGRPIGLINHAHFMSSLAKPFYKEVYLDRNCCIFMDSEPLIIEEEMPLQEVSTLIAEAGKKVAADGFLIVAAGHYRGVGHTQDVLRVMTDIHRTQSQRLALSRDRLEDIVLERTQALVEARDSAQAANVAKSAFLANMSHEIRTPMNGILGMAHLLRRGGVTPKQAERLDTIDTSAQHLLAVINDILDISKVEAGKLMLEEAPVAVGSLMANVKSILDERARARNIRLLVEVEPLPPNLAGDPTRLQQALLNYATNAIKFTETGSVTLRAVKLHETDESVLLRFEVEDTGVGIAAEAIPRLFGAFEQADNSTTRKYGGTGLGLVITRRLAELMGGEAGVTSTRGVGSTFWFTARLQKKERRMTGRTPQIVGVEAETELRRSHCAKHILIVDDEPINREVAKIQLEDTGLVIDTAEDGAQAIAKAQMKVYAAILMDMQMPNVDGLEATRQIRLIPGYRNTPIIAMTANAFAEHKARCLEAGMNDFIIKPFIPETLFATLLRSLDQLDD
jgi:signal transduction histidine kinase/ActR/RegA family two-component response regulator